ncbi:MAG: tRNA pseudouridine(55) synthase TruB, partial [Selenomonadaceae bacterium]|nr:tRNA pseudouridine(55) synthase TruB [Selenomonadaceae bacterium]
GFINLNKAAGMTSHDAVNLVRKIFQTRKVGHSGTLDPAATGVLPIAVGQATKFIEYLAECDKTYRAEILFGVETDSGDVTGQVIRSENFKMPALSELQAAAKNFTGQIEQTPPKFSAIKINGRKAYDLARKNIDFEMPRRIVTISRFEILSAAENFITAEVDCSKGTYVRSLSEDFGAAFNLPATLKSLQRIRVGNFNIENAVTIDALKSLGEGALKPVDACIDFESFNLPPRRLKAYCNGLPTNISHADATVKVYCDGKFLGVGKITRGELRAEKLLQYENLS